MDKELVIIPRKYPGETAVISSRLPRALVEELDKTAKKTGRTRNEIVQMCLEFAVENLKIEE